MLLFVLEATKAGVEAWGQVQSGVASPSQKRRIWYRLHIGLVYLDWNVDVIARTVNLQSDWSEHTITEVTHNDFMTFYDI